MVQTIDIKAYRGLKNIKKSQQDKYSCGRKQYWKNVNLGI